MEAPLRRLQQDLMLLEAYQTIVVSENEDLNPAPTKTVHQVRLQPVFPARSEPWAKVRGLVRSGGASMHRYLNYFRSQTQKGTLFAIILAPDRCVRVTTERSSKQRGTRLFVIIRTELTLFLLHAQRSQLEKTDDTHARIYKQRTV
ncbi:unnamed protein product, partial [Ectocarpus sp. 6 AP-2014]